MNKKIIKDTIYNKLGMMYIYLGDRLTSEKYKNKMCKAVKRKDGKCIRTKGKMLVEFANGERVIVLAYRLRKLKELTNEHN